MARSGIGLVWLLNLLGCGMVLSDMANFNNASHCGKTFHLDSSASVKVMRNDETSGFCGFLFHAMTDSMYTCTKVCVKVTERSINDCHARLTLTGVKFATAEDPPQEMSCFERLPDEFCFETPTMRMELVRDLQYTHAKLNISMIVTASCITVDEARRKTAEEEAAVRRAHDDVAYNNMVEGIVTGVCLSCIFLIVLLLTWCYYQNSSNRGKRYDYPSAKISKRPTFAGFKARMNFRNSRGAQAQEEPTERYTVTNEMAVKEKKREEHPLMEPSKDAEAAGEEVKDGACAMEEKCCDQEKMPSEPEVCCSPAEVSYEPATIETTCTDGGEVTGGGGDGGD